MEQNKQHEPQESTRVDSHRFTTGGLRKSKVRKTEGGMIVGEVGVPTKYKNKKRTYRCPDCGQVAVRTEKQMIGNSITKGQLPAFLVCGRCYSKKPSKTVRMWADCIPEKDRNALKYNNYGLERVLKKPKFERVHNISFANCVRYLVRVITHDSFTDEELILRAKHVVREIIAEEKVNAIAVGFWRTRGEAMKIPALAMVLWCPGGKWAEADSVETGDYKRHEYIVSVNQYGARGVGNE